MATGQRPFQGETATAVLSSIRKDTPASITEVNPSLPPLLARIIRRCLAKDPERRYQTSKDIRNELEELKQDVESGDALVGTAPPIQAAAEAPDWHPRWSPDGNEIAFYSFRSGFRDIWIMPTSGGRAHQITHSELNDWFPTWSPDV